MTNNDIDLVEVATDNFRVLMLPFQKLPLREMMPIMDLATVNPESSQLFKMVTDAFINHLPMDKVEEFQDMPMKDAIDVVHTWMSTVE